MSGSGAAQWKLVQSLYRAIYTTLHFPSRQQVEHVLHKRIIISVGYTNPHRDAIEPWKHKEGGRAEPMWLFKAHFWINPSV